MLNKISRKWSVGIINCTGEQEEMREVYQYALELLLTTATGMLAILIISVFTIGFMNGIVFLLFFASLRSVAGGYHAETYIKCFVISCFSYVVVLAMHTMLCLQDVNRRVIYIAFIISAIYILFKAPVINLINH